MYRVDRRIHRHKRARRNLMIGLVLLLSAIIVYGLLHLRVAPRQNIRNSTEVRSNFAAATQTKVDIDKPLFTLELPSGWKERGPEPAVIPAGAYTFQSSTKPSQLLSIYIDAIPVDMAVNHAVVVSGQGDGIVHDIVSGNCTTFTDASKTDPTTKIAQARWQNTNFLCDMGNYNRGVVGTQSPEGINQVMVTGPRRGAHKVFFRYTDNSVSPDYSTLYRILGSFHMK